ncbi:hypothetical protein ISN44_As06g040400 [Arabidopsis suecica]|uniref:Uncharacterized protein n=1 Tax=Arabidopsis suecica TaxID=45249 RepID=A0A8T2CNF5_ARASU|nr:hypothetical protein ISN44_As06g040400 [Arabidopsis suecica]
MAVASNRRDRTWGIGLSPKQKFYDSIRDRCFKRITENIPITQTIRISSLELHLKIYCSVVV